MQKNQSALQRESTKLAAAAFAGGLLTLSAVHVTGNGWVVIACLIAGGLLGGLLLVAMYQDETERKLASTDLEQGRAFLDMIIETAPSPIIVKNAGDLSYRLLNRAAETYLGIERIEAIGKTAREVMPPESVGIIEKEDRRVIAAGGRMIVGEHTVLTPGNGTRICTATRLPVMGNGKPQYIITVIDDITEKKRSEQEIARITHCDALTDLPNRATFNECLIRAIAAVDRSGEQFGVLYMGLDRFRTVNDVFGHPIGDALLQEIASRLKAACDGAFLARVGGDEFAVITPSGRQPAAAAALADRICAALEGNIEVAGNVLRPSLTIGVAIYPQDGRDAEALVLNADVVMSRAKEEARGSIRFFEPSMDKQLREKRVLQQDLPKAIDRDEIELHYQPQANIKGGFIGFEALARWTHSTLGNVRPGVFIPLAEESGIIAELGEWILRTACREAASWPNALGIAVNLSPAQFENGDLVALVHQVLIETGLSPSRLELEITEGVLMRDFNRAVGTLRRLKNLGVRIAMDDFGTGYSSLSYLQAFPFDKIKIDRAFVSKIGQSAQAAAIIRAVLALGRGLALPVIAEGVETEEQRLFLASEQCDQIQGYLVGKPKPVVEYAAEVGRIVPRRKARAAGR